MPCSDQSRPTLPYGLMKCNSRLYRRLKAIKIALTQTPNQLPNKSRMIFSIAVYKVRPDKRATQFEKDHRLKNEMRHCGDVTARDGLMAKNLPMADADAKN
uniref:Uncharacterized protein n=1 Tax=Romanomermis culicivorax TaxID=13658 RepID=A0A915HKV6_ROMCU